MDPLGLVANFKSNVMHNGSYHRVGKYDLWFGYQGKDKNNLRIEWPGEGLRVLNLKFRPETIVKPGRGAETKITAKTDKGTIAISRTSSGITSILVKRWLIPTFWASGEESGHKAESLIEKICTTNEVR